MFSIRPRRVCPFHGEERGINTPAQESTRPRRVFIPPSFLIFFESRGYLFSHFKSTRPPTPRLVEEERRGPMINNFHVFLSRFLRLDNYDFMENSVKRDIPPSIQSSLSTRHLLQNPSFLSSLLLFLLTSLGHRVTFRFALTFISLAVSFARIAVAVTARKKKRRKKHRAFLADSNPPTSRATFECSCFLLPYFPFFPSYPHRRDEEGGGGGTGL